MKRSSHNKIKKQIQQLERRAQQAENMLKYDMAEKLRHEIKILELVLGSMVYPYYV